jgi:hypothetical protein
MLQTKLSKSQYNIPGTDNDIHLRIAVMAPFYN